MKIMDERETQKTNEQRKNQTKTKKNKGGRAEAIGKGWELNNFGAHLSRVFSN